MKLFSADNNFPNVEARVFNILWIEMFKESIREINYAAKEANLDFTISWTGEAIKFGVFAYNDSCKNLFAIIFEKISEFNPEEEFFNNKK